MEHLNSLAQSIREKLEQHLALTKELEFLLKEARENDLEVEIIDGVQSEVSHDIDGLMPYRLKLIKILQKKPL